MLWSFQTVAEMIVQIVAAIMSIKLYVFLAAQIWPSMFLRPQYRSSVEGDRGIKRYVFRGGKAILYEPCLMYRKHLKQYILSENGKEKYIKCQFSPSVYYVVYDVVAFDSLDRVIDTVRVREDILSSRHHVSKASMLPEHTAYVKVVLRAVNHAVAESEKLFYVSAFSVIGFTMCVTVGLVAEMVLLRWILVSLAELFFSYSSFATEYGDLAAVACAVVAGPILAALICYMYRMNEKFKKFKGKKYKRK